MKKLLVLSLILSSAVSAHTIKGTLILKGSLKSKVFVNGVETTCRVKIDKVKNILDEDSYGNPGYRVAAEVSLDGRDQKRKITIKDEQKLNFTNFFSVGNKIEARDLNYTANNGAATMAINEDGRLREVQISYQGQKVTCLF